MAEAGRLADAQEQLRSEGIPVRALVIPWEGAYGGPPEEQELADFAEWATDPEDPDRSFPIMFVALDELGSFVPYPGDVHPGRCVIGPSRELLWCEHGHGEQEQEAQDFIRSHASR